MLATQARLAPIGTGGGTVNTIPTDELSWAYWKARAEELEADLVEARCERNYFKNELEETRADGRQIIGVFALLKSHVVLITYLL